VQIKDSFSRTVSGLDLIVGARTGSLNLLLSSVFGLGSIEGTVSPQSYQYLSRSTKVAWLVPLSAGDSHRGFPVLGTNLDFFEHYHYARQRSLEFKQGGPFQGTFSVVLGAVVAEQLAYKIGERIVLSHGLGEVSFLHHDQTPFVVTGILAATGTPVDRRLYTSLEGLARAHVDPEPGHQPRHADADTHADTHADAQATPDPAITAVMMGLHRRADALAMQREINQGDGEALSAIMPGLALAQLWQVLSSFEGFLRLVSALILLASLLGMGAMLLASGRERDQELFVLRAIGAHASFVFLLVLAEALLICLVAMVLGLALLLACLLILGPYIASHYGLFLSLNPLGGGAWQILLAVVLGAQLVALAPALKAYRVF
jgi:putative ABC transport system permease protein